MSDITLQQLTSKRSLKRLVKHAEHSQLLTIQKHINGLVEEQTARLKEEELRLKQDKIKAQEILSLIKSEGLSLDLLNQENTKSTRKRHSKPHHQ